MYIDEIDWNPYIDRELMEDLDLQVFCPDEAEKIGKLDTINEEVECAQTQHDKKQYTSDNPWERDQLLGTENLKQENGWDRWDDTLNLRNDDPWEQSCRKLVGSSKDNTWGIRSESWEWPQGLDKTQSSSFADCGRGKSWNCNEKTMAVREDGWGQGRRENNSWSWGPGNNNSTRVTLFETNNCIGSKETGWRDNRNVSWGVRDARYDDSEAKHWDPNFRRGGWSSRGGGRKRESTIWRILLVLKDFAFSMYNLTMDLYLRVNQAEKGISWLERRKQQSCRRSHSSFWASSSINGGDNGGTADSSEEMSMSRAFLTAVLDTLSLPIFLESSFMDDEALEELLLSMEAKKLSFDSDP
ncbi:hypothetical protein SASPL_131562 [Salvia splendens]|uniref:Uncharacterized protein n=1 Tax=Salvia splendens TaxID=180675 RepID=A0A8X8X9H7_SALSN|nr:hypothetical protein SASPL_131562 [Salvia splendens]